MIVCWDSSAIVKLLVEEPGSDVAEAMWSSPSPRLASTLIVPEVVSALSRRRSEGSLSRRRSDPSAGPLAQLFREIDLFDLTVGVAANAAELVTTAELRGADAVHLATALDAADAGATVTLATWDRRLHRAAIEAGLGVAPASFDDPAV